MSDSDRPTPTIGDEISYRSMEGCTVAVVEDVGKGSYVLDNGVTCPAHLVLDILGCSADHGRLVEEFDANFCLNCGRSLRADSD